MPHRCSSFKGAASHICFLLWAILFLSACSGLGGEPRIVATLPPAPQIAEDMGLPAEHPDLSQGAVIFAENCTRCHGISGQGNGELVLNGNLPDPPPDFNDPATIQAQSPTQWFDTITNGRLEKLMPPWRESLSEAERWSVALYTYTMSYDPEQITQGQRLWEANCAECHGETGAGDGPRAQELNINARNLSLPEALIDASDAMLFETLTQGKGDVMPAFADILSESERWAVIAFARTLSLKNADLSAPESVSPAVTAEVEATVAEVMSPAVTPEIEATAAEVFGTVSGIVTNESAGAQLPDDLVVSLQILDRQGREERRETLVNADGSFNFEDVPLSNDRGYMVTSSYQDRLFGSNLIQGDATRPTLELPFSIYELTDDRSVIQTDNIILEISRAADTLQITQIMSYTNSSDRLYTRSEQVADGRFASVVVPLPLGARVLNFADDSQRYVFADNLTAVIDTRPVTPGKSHIVHILYTLPFQEGMTVDVPLEYTLEGSVRLLVQPDSLSLTSELMPPLGRQTMGSTVFQSYGSTLSMAAGDDLLFSVNSVGVNSPASSLTSDNLLPAVLIAIGSLSILIAGVLYYLGRRVPAASAATQLRDVIIEQIAELDELHKQGQINPNAYQEQRKRLKSRLAKLIDKD